MAVGTAPTSPSIYNYSVLKATVTFEAVPLGNVSEIELTPENENLDHQSSMSGLKFVDRTVSISRKLTLRLVMDEWSDHNVRLAVMGPETGTINIYSEPEREGALVITGTNAVGQMYTWTLGSVSFIPTGSLNLISDEWATMEITGTVNNVAGIFGTVARTGGEEEPA
jgi:hypothetical protein